MANRERVLEIYAGDYLWKFRDESEIQPFTMKQLKRPVLFVSYLYGIALIVFLAEYTYFKWRDWRDRKQYVTQVLSRVSIRDITSSNCFTLLICFGHRTSTDFAVTK